MSGLFTRLARQATGQPRNPVRPATPMPYTQSSELASTEQIYPQSEAAPDAVAINPQPTAESALPLTIAVPSSARIKASPVDNAGQPRTHDRPEQVDSNRVEPRPLMSESTGDPPEPRQTEDQIIPANDSASAATDIENTGGFDHQQADGAQAESTVLALEKIIVETLVENQPQRFEASQQRPTSLTDALPVEPRTPEPLLPSLSTAPVANSVVAGQTPEVASDSPNEVHVHIGRIEVTALQPDAAPKPKPRAARQPMSLDDYLARRRQN